MRTVILILLLSLLVACGRNNSNEQKLQAQVDVLQDKLDKAYKPGFGEFMSEIQVHHEKLWFAGEAQNWALADFEMGEIKEALEGIKEYCADRPESKSITMITPAIDSLASAIKQKDLQQFKSSFVLLTNTCNSCHRATNHAFNVIKLPGTPPIQQPSLQGAMILSNEQGNNVQHVMVRRGSL